MRLGLILSVLVVIGQSAHAQTYQAEYLFEIRSVASVPGVPSNGFGSLIPIEVDIRYEVRTDGKRMTIKGVPIKTEGGGLNFREQGAEKAYVDLIAHQLFLEQADSMNPALQRLGSLHRGALLDSFSCFSSYRIAEYDPTYTITFCDTVPSLIHLAMPFEKPPGGVTHVESPSVSARLMSYQKVSDEPLSLPPFPDLGADTKAVFYFLPR